MSVFTEGVYAKELTDRVGIGVTIGPSGEILSVTGPTWQRVAADPNGVETAVAGSLASQNDGTVWANVDGGTTWQALGGSGPSGGFALLDDETGTWGTTSPNQFTSVYVSTSARFDIRGNPVSAAGTTNGPSMRLETGAVTVTGAATGGTSGGLTVRTGATDSTNAGGTGGATGALTFITGAATSTLGTSGATGDLSLLTGPSDDGNSGSVILGTGSAGGTPGTVQSISRMTTTDGVTGGTARIVGGRCADITSGSTAVTGQTEAAYSNGAYTIPTGTLKAGSTIEIEGGGVITAVSSMSPTFNLRLRFGDAGTAGAALFTSGAITVLANDIFAIRARLNVYAAGAAVTVVGVVWYDIGVPGTATTRTARIIATIDTLSARDITLTAQNGGTGGSPSSTLDFSTVVIR